MANPTNSGRRSDDRPQKNQEVREIKALPVPEDYVDAAERIMRKLSAEKRLTTTKIRNLYGMIIDVYNTENLRQEPGLLPESAAKLQMARVRFLYEAGRDTATRWFLARTKLLEYIKGVGSSREDLILLAHYMEALVAYHRYFGGREN